MTGRKRKYINGLKIKIHSFVRYLGSSITEGLTEQRRYIKTRAIARTFFFWRRRNLLVNRVASLIDEKVSEIIIVLEKHG